MPPASPQLQRLSVEDVFRTVEAGILGEEDRVELLDGVLYDMTPPGDRHSGAVAWLTRRLVAAAGEREIRVQDVLYVPGGVVRPDLMAVDPIPERDRQPHTAHLAVEVAVTTHAHDRMKARHYGRAGVAELWIVDVPGQAVLVHRGPGPTGFAQEERRTDGERLSVPFADLELDVTELLGPSG